MLLLASVCFLVADDPLFELRSPKLFCHMISLRHWSHPFHNLHIQYSRTKYQCQETFHSENKFFAIRCPTIPRQNQPTMSEGSALINHDKAYTAATKAVIKNIVAKNSLVISIYLSTLVHIENEDTPLPPHFNHMTPIIKHTKDFT